jgi:uncharacterized membrane protein
MTVAMILVLYGVANAMLFYKKGGFSYSDDDLFFIMTSIFLFMIILILPRTVAIMLGSESQAQGNKIQDEETSDSGDPSRC